MAVNTPLSDKISLYKLKPCDWKELLQLIERIRKRVAQELKKPVEVISCYDRKAIAHIAKAVGARALVLNFRRSPEHKFPAG